MIKEKKVYAAAAGQPVAAAELVMRTISERELRFRNRLLLYAQQQHAIRYTKGEERGTKEKKKVVGQAYRTECRPGDKKLFLNYKGSL